jgi:hypothetical protein
MSHSFRQDLRIGPHPRISLQELEEEVASDRRYGIAKLAAMAGAPEESERRAAKDVTAWCWRPCSSMSSQAICTMRGQLSRSLTGALWVLGRPEVSVSKNRYMGVHQTQPFLVPTKPL